MVLLTRYEAYFEALKADVPEIKLLLFVTDESEINKRISDIKANEQPFLVVLIPSAKTNGSAQDDVEETNYALIYLLSKEDKTRTDVFSIQKKLQPVIEQIKKKLIDSKDTCGLMNGLLVHTMHTDPESRMLSVASGWSLSFEFKTE